MKFKFLFKGILKSIPGIEHLYEFNKNTGGSCNARYCYSVWLRHLIFAYQNGITSIPKVVAELGPGDSLGVGIAALISGAEKYYALDVKMYSNVQKNLNIFHDLVFLFKNKLNIPNEEEFQEVRPLLANYDFPTSIFTENHLNNILSDSRLNLIETAIKTINSSSKNKLIEYTIPWYNNDKLKDETIDMIISQAVLQDVENLDFTYMKMSQLLKPGGLQSHDIGFKSCETADTWYGHWKYTDFEWKIVNGRKKIRINREPYSTHLKLISRLPSKLIFEQKRLKASKIDKTKLAPRFRNLTDDDLKTYSAFIQAKKYISD